MPTLAKPTLAQPTLASLFGDRVWPKTNLTCGVVSVVVVVVCGVVLVSRFHGVFVVMFGAPGTALGPPFPQTALHGTALPLDQMTRELETCTFEGPGASNKKKIPRKQWRESEQKAHNFGPLPPSTL